MQKSKLISILGNLTNREIKWFDAYIQSPFFNKNKKVVMLFKALKKYHPDYPDDKVEMDKIYPKVFPGSRKLDEQKLRYVMTDLTKLLEDYIAFIVFNDNEIYKKSLLLNAYNNRGLSKFFSQTMELTKEIQQKSLWRDYNYYFNQHLIEEVTYAHSLTQNPNAISSSLQEAVDNLDYYYLSNRLRYSCAILSREEFLQEKYNNIFQDEIINFMAKIDLEHVPSISVYYQIVLMFLEIEEERHYRKLKNLLEKYTDVFPPEERKDIYTHALNYCIKKLNKGNLSFFEETHELYKVMIDKEIIFEDGYISANSFKNIVTLALQIDKIEWTEDFIETYKDRIFPEHKESTFAYNMANLHYHKREFSKALRLMQTVETNDIYYNIGAKILLLKTYYELNESDPFLSLTDAFSNYLKRNKLISDNLRAVTLNFVRLSRKLMQIRMGGRTTTEDLRKELAGDKGVANLQWLEKKLEELEMQE